MSRINKPLWGHSSSGRSKARIVTIVAGAALFGTIVGGASAVGVVMAIVQPSAHDVRADAEGGGTSASRDAPATQAQAVPPSAEPVTATASVQTQTPVPAQASSPPAPSAASPSPTWLDALSRRSDHDAAATAARDPNGSLQNADPAAPDRAAPADEPTVAERAPWPNPVPPGAKAAKRRAAAVSEPVPSATAATAAQPTPPNAAAADNTINTPTNQKPRLAQQPQRSRDAADQGSDDRAPAAYPPRQRVIVLAPAERDASTERDHGDHPNGLFGLFDFFGHDHWNDQRWSNDRWHDDHD
jgi:hypothetical protein